jgi:hypothetical protein
MGFELSLITLVHVVISVLGIIAGLVVVGGLLAGARLDGWTALFLATTLLTSVTGFFFPSAGVTPPKVVGALSIVMLALCAVSRYQRRLAGAWRTTYVVSAVAALYLNVFVLVVQLFTKTPALAQLAPTQKEPPFAATQLLVLGLFAWLGWAAVRGFRTGAGNAMDTAARGSLA